MHNSEKIDRGLNKCGPIVPESMTRQKKQCANEEAVRTTMACKVSAEHMLAAADTLFLADLIYERGQTNELCVLKIRQFLSKFEGTNFLQHKSGLADIKINSRDLPDRSVWKECRVSLAQTTSRSRRAGQGVKIWCSISK